MIYHPDFTLKLFTIKGKGDNSIDINLEFDRACKAADVVASAFNAQKTLCSFTTREKSRIIYELFRQLSKQTQRNILTELTEKAK